jgi:hypothetical protein
MVTKQSDGEAGDEAGGRCRCVRSALLQARARARARCGRDGDGTRKRRTAARALLTQALTAIQFFPTFHLETRAGWLPATVNS